MSNNKNSVVINFIWRFMERCGAQLVTFVVSIVLARLLDPEVYGTVALVTVFTTILQTFVDSGLGNALIQKKDADDLDFSSVFYVNIVFCTVLYIGICLASPLIASFYERPELVPVICVVSLMIVISGVRNVQQAYVSRKMMFKKFFFATLGGTVAAAVVGITMAALGFGVWALVVQMLVNFAVGTLVLWVTVKWRPKRMFSFERVKSLFSFGWKLLVSSLLETVYKDVRQLIIGKMYSAEDLAFYNKGMQFPNLVITNVNISIDSVLLPAMSNVQNDRAQVRAMTRRAMKTSTFILFPLMVGLGVCADFLIPLLLTEKWSFCIPYLRIFCFTYAFYPIHTANLNAIKAMGRSDLFLVLEIVKKIIGVVLLVATMWFGVMAMAYSLLVSTILSSIVNAFPNRKLLNYSYIEQIKDLLPTMAISAVMGVAVYCVGFLNLGAVITLAIQVPLGAVIYIVLAKLFKLESFEYVLSVVKGFICKK
ncbi:MAG: lipopolysaccharide biosynthesis protein [Ruminococcaceae bacterium]|nr:lipopolysaccharide biosynthesis protein [Oscillospiraceae bacterium]